MASDNRLVEDSTHALWKDVIVLEFEALPQHLPLGTEEVSRNVIMF
jgi:hypothetical protein